MKNEETILCLSIVCQSGFAKPINLTIAQIVKRLLYLVLVRKTLLVICFLYI